MMATYYCPNGMKIEYVCKPGRTEIEMVNDADALCYGIDEVMTMEEICTEQLEELRKYKQQSTGFDPYYRDYDEEFLRDVVDALTEIMKKEQ